MDGWIERKGKRVIQIEIELAGGKERLRRERGESWRERGGGGGEGGREREREEERNSDCDRWLGHELSRARLGAVVQQFKLDFDICLYQFITKHQLVHHLESDTS